jgi:hypothetical protein
MAIILNGDTGISSIGALSGVTSISATNAALTGITSVASNAADTPVILQDSSANSATCRAWVNFDGTGTPAIRADFNVSSITDNGTGDYTVNFTNALPDANYSAITTGGQTGAGSTTNSGVAIRSSNTSGTGVAASYATTSIRIQSRAGTGTATDPDAVSVAIFR